MKTNPLILCGYREYDFFCDRDLETKRLTDPIHVANQVLFARL